MAGSTVDALNVRIGANASPLQRTFKNVISQLQGMQTKTAATAKSMQSSFAGVVPTLQKTAAAVATIVSAKKLIDFGKQAIEAGSALTEVQNVVDTVFGSMTQSINDWSKSAMTAFGLSETSAKRYTSTMGAMLKSSGIAGESLKTMSINMAALSADMASFYNLSSDTAFEKIRAGISGETEPLKQLGINMSVANMEAYALSQGITKSYSAMSQAEQTMLRYNYLLSVTGDAQHDFARTSTSWANQTRILAEQFNRLKTIIGQGLIQALTPLINVFNMLIAKVVEFATALSKMFGGSGESASSGMSDLASSAGSTSDELAEADKNAKKLKSTISGFDELHILDDDSTADAGSVLDNLKPVDVYGGMSSGIDSASEKMQELIVQLKEKLEPVVTLAKDIKESFVKAFDTKMQERFVSNLRQGLLTVADIIGSFAESFDKAWTNDDAGTRLIESIGNALNDILELANDVGADIAEALSSDAGLAWTDSLIAKWQAFVDMIGGITQGLQNAWNDGGAGEQYIESIFNSWGAVNTAIAAVQTTIGAVFASDVGQSFFSQIISLCTTWNEIVATVVDTFTVVWTEARLGDSIVTNIIEIVKQLVGFVTDIGTHFLQAWRDADTGKALLTALGELVDNVLGFVRYIAETWRDLWDNDTSTEIWNDLLGLITNIVDFVKALVTNITDAIKESGLLSEAIVIVQNAISAVIEFAKMLFEKLTELAQKIDWSPLTGAFSNVLGFIRDIVNYIKEMVGDGNGLLSQLLDAFFEIFGETLQFAIETIADAINIVVEALKLLKSLFKWFVDFIKGDYMAAAQDVYDMFDGIIKVIKTLVDWVKKAVSWLGQLFSYDGKSVNVSTATSSYSDISAYSALDAASVPALATGGMLSAGQLFVANEQNGNPELVGSAGGRSVVMNNQQIVDAVSDGVATAVQPLVEAMQGGSSEQTVSIRGTDLVYILNKVQKRRGATISNNFGFGGV